MHGHERRNLALHQIFRLGMWVKAIDGALECIGGLTLLLTTRDTLDRLVIALTQHELVEDPRDIIANALRHAAAQLPASAQLFGAAYLIAHGLIKVGLVAGLLSGRRWAYPAAIGFLCLFIVYQIYRLSYQFSAGLLLLTLFDLAMVWLTWREARSAAAAPARKP